MNENGDTPLLIEMREMRVEIKCLAATLERIHDQGFHRCATQEQRIGHLEKSLELSHERISGMKRWLVTGLVAIISFCVTVIWNIIQSSLK